MFKSVEYVGFEDKPELRARAAELTPLLAKEIQTWREDVVVRWSPSQEPDGIIDLTLSLTLPNGVSATHTGTFRQADFARPPDAMSRCRWVWMDLLGKLIELLDSLNQESILEPAEA
ncbi:MAG: hypothetical protein L0241_15230 [Planctomycetia bacterium]|nr:hypothetical protein [Planctomycetia bacterium]